MYAYENGLALSTADATTLIFQTHKSKEAVVLQEVTDKGTGNRKGACFKKISTQLSFCRTIDHPTQQQVVHRQRGLLVASKIRLGGPLLGYWCR